jgi:hypothetical protein
VLEHIAASRFAGRAKVYVHGLPANEFVEHGNTDELLAELDLMPDGIARVARTFMGLPADVKDLVTA